MRIVLLLSFLCSAVWGKEDWWRVLGEIEEGDYSGGYRGEDGKEVADFCRQTEFTEWEIYEDDYVSFKYPKHPLLKLRVEGGEEGIEVEGGVCTTVDNSYQKAYVLEAGDQTYGVFLLTPAKWLDDGI